MVASEDFFTIAVKNLSIPQHEDSSVNKDHHIENLILKSIEKCNFNKSIKLVPGGFLNKRTTFFCDQITLSDIKKRITRLRFFKNCSGIKYTDQNN